MKKRFLKLTTLLIPVIALSVLQGCGKETKPSGEETNIPPKEISWTFNTNAQINSSPVAFENTVIFGNASMKLYSVDVTTQKEVWTKSLDGVVSNTLLVDGTTLIFSTYTTCYAINAKTGDELWKYSGDGKVTDNLLNGYDYHSPSPVLYKDKVIFPTVSGNIYCLDKVTGKLDWQYKESGTADMRVTPAILNDKLYLADVKGAVYAMDLNTQKTLWNVKNGSDVAHSIVAYKDIVFVGGRNTKVVAYEAQTGKSKWEHTDKVGSWFTGEMQVVNDILYVPGSDNHAILALSYDSGNIVTNYIATSNVFSKQLIVNDKIYITYGNVYSNDEGGIISYKLGDSSNALWKAETKIPSYSSPCIINDTLYFGGTDGKLYAVKTQ
ncbi:MAG: PQQ-binding-like beta-propeller repeat protein [Clostridium sp.]